MMAGFLQAPGYALQDPSIVTDQAALDRQMQLAQMLRAQSVQGFGPTESVNGYAVKRSPLEAVAKIVQALMANKLDKTNDAGRAAIAQKQGTAMQSMMANLLGGSPAAANTADPAIGPPEENAAPPQIGQPGGPPAPPAALTFDTAASSPQESQIKRAATAALLMGNNDLANKLVGNLLEMTPQQKDWSAQGISPSTMAPFTVAAAQKSALHEQQPGSITTNLATGQQSFAPKVGEGIRLNPATGAASEVPNYSQAAAAITGANAQATEDAKLVDVDVGGGKTMKMTIGQYRDLTKPKEPPLVTPGEPIRNGGKPYVYNIGGKTGIAPGVGGPVDQAVQSGMLGVKDPIAEQVARTYGTKKAEAAVSYGTDLANRVSEGQDLMSRVAEMRKALENFKPGMGAETRLNLARAASAVGVPDDVVQKIAGGDVSALQEFDKISAQTALQAVKQAMGSSGRITQAEFKVFLQNNPNIALSRPAMESIFNFMQGQYKRDFAEQVAREQYLDSGEDPSRWQARWSQMMDPTGRGSIDLVRAPPKAVAGKTGGPPATAPVVPVAPGTPPAKVRRYNPATGLIE